MVAGCARGGGGAPPAAQVAGPRGFAGSPPKDSAHGHELDRKPLLPNQYGLAHVHTGLQSSSWPFPHHAAQ